MPHLFEELRLRGAVFPNRIAVSPMCMYSSEDGLPSPWHLVHLGSRAIGGAGVVMTEATAVTADGRISLGDTGIWNDAQAEAWAPIAKWLRRSVRRGRRIVRCSCAFPRQIGLKAAGPSPTP